MNVKEIKLGFIYENEIMVVWLLISKNVCDFFKKILIYTATLG